MTIHSAVSERFDLNPLIIDRLKNEFQMSERGEHLRAGLCPDCGKKTLWTWANKPGRIQCNRTNNCNYSATSKELFPDLFEKINKKYPASPENPNATADAYLSIIRGFDILKIKDWYEQNKYWNPHADKGTATVRFFLDDKKSIIWERFIEDVTITDEDGDKEIRNKNFKGAFKGLWWQPPGFEINEGDEIHWCEGILDAIALNMMGIKAVAIMSSGTFPHESIKPYIAKNITWVIALDNDVTGRKFLTKHSKKLRDMDQSVDAMLSSSSEEKADWNDLFKDGKLTDKNIKEYRYLGRLELSTNYKQKAQMMWQHNTSKIYFVYSFFNRTYSARVNKTEFEKSNTLYWAGVAGIDPSRINDDDIKKVKEDSDLVQHTKAEEYAFSQACKINKIASFQIDFLYFQEPDNGEEGQYFFRFKLSNNSPEKQLAFTHKSISAASDFKRSALRIPGAQFTGNTNDLDQLYDSWTSYIPKIVRTLDFIGYDKDSKTYVFNDYAVESGRILKLNAESFFQLKKSGIKTMVDIRQRLELKHNDDWLADFMLAFGMKGMIALSWWFGCLFVEQVRDNFRSYPFFEVIGEAGSGKSDMVDFLWKLLGKEGESFNPNASTLAGRTRKMAEVSNMPVVFNETDNEEASQDRHLKRFNWDEQKDLFDGEFGRVTGVKSQDNSTKKAIFKAGLMIVQNIPVQASEAILSRICHLQFDCTHHSIEGKHASDRLNMLPLSETSGFMLNSVKQADRVMKHFSVRLNKHRIKLQQNKEIKLQRIVENHAKVMAFADCLKGAMPGISDEVIATVHEHIEEMAVERQASLNLDHPIIQQFWGQFDYLDSKPLNEMSSSPRSDLLNHSASPENEIAMNLEHFHSQCRVHGLPMIEPKELRRHLPTSRKRKYIKNDPVTSRLEKRSVRCWIFEK